MRELAQLILSPVGAVLSPLFPVRLPELTHEELLAVRLSVGELETIKHEPYAGITRRIERQTGIQRVQQETFVEDLAQVLHEKLGALNAQ